MTPAQITAARGTVLEPDGDFLDIGDRSSIANGIASPESDATAEGGVPC